MCCDETLFRTNPDRGLAAGARRERHGFSFPLQYFEKYGLRLDWQFFLDDFQRQWPTDEDICLDFVRDRSSGNGAARSPDVGAGVRGPAQTGRSPLSIMLYKGLAVESHHYMSSNRKI
jgi:hypothetical protein